MDAAEFEMFWREYPGQRVGKIPAQKEYAKARKTATAEDILDGVRRYRANKPAWQQWAHARTWLHQQRWTDVYETAAVTSAPNTSREEIDDYHVWRRAAVERQKQQAS